tara:strand:- start:18 stop:623 length:606 start_codon:yes stop_codon:yes gene_type:complete
MTSKLIVNSIRHTGASADAITMDASGNVTFPGNATCSGTPSGFGGVTMIDQYRVTSNATGDQEPIQNNLERVDNARNGLLNAGMTVSSGVWTFPSTGYYEIYAQVVSYVTSGVNNRELRFYMYTTVDNGSNWNDSVHAYDQQYDSGSNTWATSQFNYVIDITDTSNDKVKFHFSPDNTNAIMRGDTNVNYSYIVFKKIAAT